MQTRVLLSIAQRVTHCLRSAAFVQSVDMSAAAAAVAAARDDAVDGAGASGSAKALIRVHRCRFADWQPAAVVSLAVSSNGRRMAVGRQSGDIEIWNVSHGFYCQRVIPGSGEPTVQVLAWVKGTGESGEEDGERLLSAGLNARVIEWDLNRLLPKSASDSYGGAVWCGALSRAGDRLALGCEDGSIRVFDVTDRGTGSSAPAYAFALLGHTGRVLSVAWSHDGSQLVSGGSDSTIRQWAVASQRNTARITVETLGKEKTLVWAVKLLRDNTVVSGDSLGHVQFWDARFGTLLHSFTQHQADVLALAVTPSEGAVYASGADNKVVEFRRVTQHAAAAADGAAATAGVKWVVTAGQRPHTHDVHALAIIPRVVTVASSSSSSAAAAAAADAKAKPSSSSHAAAAAAAGSGAQRVSQHLLVSGGVDTQLCVYHCQSFQHKPHKILPIPHRSPVSLAVPQRMFLMHQHRRLEMWELGRATTESELSTTGGANVREGTAIATASTYNHVLTINTSSVLHLCCSALAPNARWAVCSDPIKLRLFALTPSEDNASAFDVRPVDVSAKLPPAYSVLFSPDSSRLFVATLDSTVVVFDLNQQKVVGTFAHHTAQDDDDDSDSDADGDAKGAVAKAKKAKSALTALPHADEAGVIHTLAVSSDGQWLASGDHFNRLHVFNLDAMQHHATLPVFESPHLAVAFQPHTSALAVTCASNALYVYDVEERRLTDWSRDNSHALPRQLVARSDKVVGVSFDAARPNVLLLHAHSFVCHVDLDKPIAPLTPTAVPSALAALGLSGPAADPKGGAAVGGKRSHGTVAQTPAKSAKTSANASATDGAAARGGGVAATPAAAKAAAAVPATGSKQSLSAIAQSLQATRAQLQKQKDDAAADTNFRVVERYRPLLHAQYVSAPASSSSSDSAAAAAAAGAGGSGSGSELLVVEVPWLKVMQTFPDPLYRHKYGS